MMWPPLYPFENHSSSPYNTSQLGNQNFGMGLSEEQQRQVDQQRLPASAGSKNQAHGHHGGWHMPHPHMPNLLRRLSSKEGEGSVQVSRQWSTESGRDREPQGPEAEEEKREAYLVSMDVGHFLPNEIGIRTQEDKVVIEGNHEERPDGHGLVTRSFTRKYILPNWVDAKTLTANLDQEGILHLSAKKHKADNKPAMI